VLEKYYVSEGPAASVFKVEPKYVCNRYLPDADDLTASCHAYRRLKTVYLCTRFARRSDLLHPFDIGVSVFIFEWLSTLKLCAGRSLCSDRIRAGQP